MTKGKDKGKGSQTVKATRSAQRREGTEGGDAKKSQGTVENRNWGRSNRT